MTTIGRLSLVATLMFILAVPAAADVVLCAASTTTEPPVNSPPGNYGPVDFRWSCQQQDCSFSPVISQGWLDRGLRDIDWYFEPEGVHVHSMTLREVGHHFPPTFSETTYRQRVVFTFGTGDVIPVEHLVTIKTTPAAAYWAENAVQAGLSVFLEPNDAELNYVQYHWDFGDGTTNDDPLGGWSRSVFCKTYDQPGQKTITLTTYDYRQEPHDVPVIDSYTKTIYVGNKAPIADGTVSVNGAVASFDGSRSLDEVPAGHKWNPARQSCITLTPMTNEATKTYEWDFGDGAYGSGATTTHTYTTPGAKTAVLSVVDRAGAVSKKTLPFTIADNPPTAAIAFRCAGRTCMFDGGSSRDDFDQLTSWEWTINGVRLPETSASVSYTFPSDGDFVVKLAVRDEVQISPPVSRIASIRSSVSPALGLVALAPCRAFDSRDPRSGGRLTDGVERIISIPSQCGSVPPDAKAVAVVITAINPSSTGHLLIWGDGTAAPSTPALNFTPSLGAVSNDALIQTVATTRAQVRVLPSIPVKGGSTDITVDVTGYFTDASAATAASFIPTNPCRLVDSRDPAAYPGAAMLNSGTTAYVKVQGAIRCAVPAGLGDGAAAALNVTAVSPSTAGAISVGPSSLPPSSATNVVSVGTARNVSTATLATLGNRSADDLAVTFIGAGSASNSQYLLDLTGYFRVALDKNLASNIWYRAIRPCRLVDTRDPLRGESALTSNTVAAFQVRGNCGVPTDAAAVFVNATVVSPSASGHLQLWAADNTPPSTTVLHFPAGVPAFANGSIVALGASTSPLMRDLAALTTTSGTGTAHLVLDVYGYFSNSTTVKSNEEQE